jgi:hypothetical protein
MASLESWAVVRHQAAVSGSAGADAAWRNAITIAAVVIVAQIPAQDGGSWQVAMLSPSICRIVPVTGNAESMLHSAETKTPPDLTPAAFSLSRFRL